MCKLVPDVWTSMADMSAVGPVAYPSRIPPERILEKESKRITWPGGEMTSGSSSK